MKILNKDFKFLTFYLKPLKLSIPVASAYLPLGMILGILWTTQGIEAFWAFLAALFIFAGSIEFLVVGFIVADLGLFSIAWSTLLVNFRHIFYGLSFPIEKLSSTPQKLYGIFALTDETYSITYAGEGRNLTGTQITLLQILSHSWWVLGTVCGAFFGQFISEDLKGFEFALTAMFITLYMDTIQQKKDLKIVIFAGISASIGFLADAYIYPESFLFAGLTTYVILISLSYLKKHKD